DQAPITSERRHGRVPPPPPPRPGDRPRRPAVGAAPRGVVRRPPLVPARAGRAVASSRPVSRVERDPLRAEGAAARGRSAGVRRPPPSREPRPADRRGGRRRRGAGSRYRDPGHEVPAPFPAVPAVDDAPPTGPRLLSRAAPRCNGFPPRRSPPQRRLLG